MITLRPFDNSDEDYRRVAAIDAAVHEQPAAPVEEWKHDDNNRSPQYPFFRDIVLRDGQVVAFVETYQNRYAFHPQKYHCRMYVEPQYDDADVRPAVLEHVLVRLADKDLIAILSGMLDDKPYAMRFFEEYGFEKVAEEKISRLDVTRFESSAFEDTLRRVRESGIEIVPLPLLQQRDPQWQRNLYDLDVTVNRDIPSTGEKHYPDFEEWLPWRLAGPTYDPEAWFIALDGEAYVGHTKGDISRDSNPLQFNTGVTTVRRDYRRRGIATALKVHIIEFARQEGVQQIVTTNDSQNPMYRLNLKLGFEPMPSWVRVEKTLKSEG
jgi:GNAT superfamily N-acetyltransferase